MRFARYRVRFFVSDARARAHIVQFQGRPEWLTMNRSVTHPELPEVKGVVRASSIVTGTHTVRNADGSVAITYITNGDVGGWLPKPVVN